MQEIALGELRMSVEEFANATIGEITALVEGYQRRYDRLEDLFILWAALPTYQTQLGKKAPTYKKLTSHRTRSQKIASIDEETQKYWREVLADM